MLTAAHCVDGPTALVIRVGDYNSGFYEDTEEVRGGRKRKVERTHTVILKVPQCLLNWSHLIDVQGLYME